MSFPLFSCYVTPQCALKTLKSLENAPPPPKSKQSILLQHFSRSFSRTLFLSFALTLQVRNPSPQTFPTIRCCSVSVTLPFILFKGEGSHLFLGYLPIAMMVACLIITDSSLAYCCFYSIKLASQVQCVVFVEFHFK